MSQKPSHIVFFVKESDKEDASGNKKSYWTRIGAAWTTKNGHLSTKLELIPNGPGSILIVSADHLDSQQ